MDKSVVILHSYAWSVRLSYNVSLSCRV